MRVILSTVPVGTASARRTGTYVDQRIPRSSAAPNAPASLVPQQVTTVTLRHKEMKRVAMDAGLDVRHLRRTAPAEARAADERTAGHDAERRFR